MRNVLEKKIEAELIKQVKNIGGICIKFISQGNNGIPDRICIFPGGKLIFVELKKPKGGKLFKIQKYQHERLKKLGQEVKTIWDYEDIEELINGV